MRVVAFHNFGSYAIMLLFSLFMLILTFELGFRLLGPCIYFTPSKTNLDKSIHCKQFYDGFLVNIMVG